MASWKKADLMEQSGAPDAQGRPFAYLTNQGSVPRVLYQGTDAHVHELRLEDNSWKKADLTALTGAPDAAGRPFAYETSSGGHAVPRVIYRGQDGDVHELRLEGGSWKKGDLTQLSGGAPSAAGNPSAGVSGDVDRVVFRAGDGHIHEVRLEDNSWKKADLSEQSGAPPATGDPLLYVTPHGGGETVRVLFTSSDAHIHEIRLDPGDNWKKADLNGLAGAPDAASEPFAYVAGNTPRIVYRDTNGHIQEVRLDGGSWKKGDLTELAGAAPAQGNPSAYATDNIPRVVYRTGQGDIMELRLEGGSWKKGDLTELASAPSAAGDPVGYRLSGHADIEPRVIYRGGDAHIYELRLE